MADDRLTPKDIELLIASGDLTQDDLALMYRQGDKRGWATAMKLMSAAGKGPEMMGQPIAPPGLVKGMSTITDFLSYATGIPFGSMGKRGFDSKKPATPNVPSSPSGPPPRGSGGSRTTPNFERHGNVTRPGPDAQKGGGGPSRTSPEAGPVRNPAKETDGFIGPTGNPDNYRTLPGKKDGPARRTGPDMGPPPGVAERRQSPLYQQMKDSIEDPTGFRQARARQNASRRPPLSDSDPAVNETENREVMFGGTSIRDVGQRGKYVKPSDRKPISAEGKAFSIDPQSIKEMIALLKQMQK